MTVAVEMHVLGASAALGAAALWAVSAVLFRSAGDRVSALMLNFAKGVVAVLCLGLLLLPQGIVLPDFDAALLLAASGLIGICLGDTLYFVTLMRLGPRRTLVVTTLVPVVAALGAVIWFDEVPEVTAWIGMALVLGGVGYVLRERSSGQSDQAAWFSGVLLAIGYVVAEAAGILLTKAGVGAVPALEATLVRQLAALAGLGLWLTLRRNWGRELRPLQDRRILRLVAAAGFVGAFLGMWFSVAALKFTYAAVAATLSAASPLFILPLVVIVYKERVTKRAMAAALVAVAGVGLIFVGG